MQKLLEKYVPHLIALNFGNEQLARITDKQQPRLPAGDALIVIDFSASPHFFHGSMSQHDYQTTQSFGLISCVAFCVTKDVKLKKAVYELMFTDTTDCTKRICQGLDFALVELQSIMLSDGIELKNLYLYLTAQLATKRMSILSTISLSFSILILSGSQFAFSNDQRIITNLISTVREGFLN